MDTSVLELGLTNLRRARSAASGDVELLEGVETIAERVADVAGVCRTLFQAMLRPDPLCTPLGPFFDGMLTRGVAVTSVWTGARGYWPHAGETQYSDRVMGEPPIERMVIFDRTVAVVAVPGISVVEAALFVHGAGRVRPYVRVFDRAGSAPSRGHGRPWLSADQQRVLALLRDGYRDAEIAATLGVTDRTVRRHVHALQRRSGARTRFQLGAWAAPRAPEPRDQPK